MAEHTVARAISACARCRSRKSKCDGKLPACGSCVKAKVECVGFDAVSKKNVSRSYLYELEQEIVTLRRELAARGGGEGPPSILPGLGAPPPPQSASSPGQYYAQPTQEAGGSSSHIYQQQGYNPDDLPQGAVVQSPPYGAFYPHPLPEVKSEGQAQQPSQQHQQQQQQQQQHAAYQPMMIDPSLQQNGYQPQGYSHARQSSSNGSMTPGAASMGEASGSQSSGVPGRDIGSLLNGVGFAGHESGEQKFMGSSSGISLARMVLSSVMKTGPAGATHPNYQPPPQTTFTPSSPTNHAEAEALDALAQLGQHPHPEFTTSTTVAASNGAGQSLGPRRKSSASVNPSPGADVEKRKKVEIPALPPRGAIERLLEVYNQYIQFQNQTLHMPSFLKQLSRVLDEPDEATEEDLFFVLMFLALSTMALSRTLDPTSDLRMSSEAFHAEAMKHIDCILNSSNHVGLQGVLLCCQYALFNPGRGSIWYLTGMAMRQCIEYGYHHEVLQHSMNASPLEIDMKRRLFWTTYKLDRQLCFNLGRPPMISDEFINTPYPSLLDDSLITETSLGPGEPFAGKMVSRHVIVIRQIQSDIQRRLHRVSPGDKRDLQGMPEQAWFDNMLEKLKDWLASVPGAESSFTSAEMWAVMFHNSVLLLFRPSPACPRPTRAALSACLRSSSYLIRIVRRMYQANKMNYLWLGAHTLFMAGITYLYSLWNVALGNIDDPPSLTESMMDIQSCSSVLQALSFNVSSSAACRETFEVLSTAVLRRLTDESVQGGLGQHTVGEGNAAVDNDGDGDNPMLGENLDSQPGAPSPFGGLSQSVQQEAIDHATPAAPLPSDLQGLDDLFLYPLGSTMLGETHPTGDPFGLGPAGGDSAGRFDHGLFESLINSPRVGSPSRNP